MSYDELESWWLSTTPETQAALQQVCVGFAALVCGYFLGAMVYRVLTGVNFDASMRLPSTSPTPESERGITPSVVAGFLVCLSVWAVAAWWVARQHGQVEFAGTLGVILTRTWGLAALVLAFLTLGSILSQRLIACLHVESPAGPAITRFQTSDTGKPVEVSHRGLAGAIGAGAYVLVLLLVLLRVAADSFDWPLTRSATTALWQFAQQLLLAVSALFIGCLGARWARDMITADSTASPEKRFGEYTAAALVATTTVLAVGVLLFGAKVLVVVAAVAMVAFLAWSVRAYVPDVTAGLQLRAYKVAELRVEGEQPWQLVKTGLLTTELTRGGEFCRLRNRKVLEVCLHGTQS